MSQEQSSDLLPIAGPSKLSPPANILIIPRDELTSELVFETLSAQNDSEAINTAWQFINTRSDYSTGLVKSLIENIASRFQTEDPGQPSNDITLDHDLASRRNELLALQSRLDTYAMISNIASDNGNIQQRHSSPSMDRRDDMQLDDPWAEVSDMESLVRIDNEPAEVTNDMFKPSLPDFLSRPLSLSAIEIAATGDTRSVSLLFDRHTSELEALPLLDALPLWTSPTELTDKIFPLEPDWFIRRIAELDEIGLIDIQIAWIQRGASLGISGLNSVGEELSLLSRLVYDSGLLPAQQREWSLLSWRTASSEDIVKAYLSHATTDTIVADIRRLVLPYLYVLDSQAERAGKPHTTLVSDHLSSIILSLPLTLALPIFECSKATLSKSDRIVQDDQTVARLALAILYGSNTHNEWPVMSAVFECLPVWDVSGGDLLSDQEATATTLDAIAAFVRPSRAGASAPTAKDLYYFFALPFASLSRALDILDVHLESGEILSRWGTPVQLRFLLQSARNKADQIDLAEKMVRRQATGPHTEQRWHALWLDMNKLSGGEDALLRGAFGVLEQKDLETVYLGGLLSSGNFDMVRKIISRLGIDVESLESIVLQTSREFYENAESGNIHTGEMKLAYDCLSIPPLSEAIKKEREFIEATSRMTTFSIKGRGKLSPLEIRHAKSRLQLLKQVVESSEDSYRHPDLMLEMLDKLGYRSDNSARSEILALLCQSATRDGDYDAAYGLCQDMFRMAQQDKGDIIWKPFVQLGMRVEFAEVDKRMTLLGQVLEICPPGEMPKILQDWRRVENGQVRLAEAAKRRRTTGIRSARRNTPHAIEAEERVLGSRTAARAAKLAMGFAGSKLNIRSSPLLASSPTMSSSHGEPADRRSNESDRPSFGAIFDGTGVKAGTAEAERVRQQARKVLVRGVGWLLGADEHDIRHE